MFLLLEPAVELLQTARVRNRFAILVDASRSMAFPAEADGPTRAAAAAAFLAEHRRELERLSDRVDLEWYAFGEDVAPTDATEATRGIARAPAAPISSARCAAPRAALEAPAASLPGVLVVSDGADNAKLEASGGGRAEVPGHR